MSDRDTTGMGTDENLNQAWPEQGVEEVRGALGDTG